MKDFLQRLAHESAKIINPLFADPNLQVEWKADNTPVTYADKKAEEVMRNLIIHEFPDHGIIGEEFEDLNRDAEYTWILDPIDGTKAFTAGCPLFGTLICLRHHKTPIWGAIHISSIGQLYIGNNETCWCNDRRVTMRETPNLDDCFLLTTDPKSPSNLKPKAGWNALLNATGEFRSWGDCFGYTLVANGGADIMCDPILSVWDLAALLPVVRGAGAIATDWHGLPPEESDSLVVAHPKHHAKIIEILNP